MHDGRFDPSGFYEFNLNAGMVRTRTGERVAIVSEDVLSSLVAAAARDGDLTPLRRLGELLGEQVLGHRLPLEEGVGDHRLLVGEQPEDLDLLRGQPFLGRAVQTNEADVERGDLLGEDPRFIARRLVILASEDIGNADPRGLDVWVNPFPPADSWAAHLGLAPAVWLLLLLVVAMGDSE